MVPMIASGLAGWAALAGLTFGVGGWLLIGLVPRLGRPSLALRVAPYAVGVSHEARELVARRAADPLPVFGMVFGPLTNGLRRLVATLAGNEEAVRQLVRQAGWGMSVEAFRSRQLSAAVAGSILGVVVVAIASPLAPISPAASVVIPFLVGAIGFWLPDVVVMQAATRRLARLNDEFPTVLEFLTLSLSAGEGLFDATRRVAALGSGELSIELRAVVSSVHAGVPFASALATLSDDLRLAPVTRCVEQLLGGMERGTPLVEVLRAQAQDVRDESRRRLLEVAGRKEVSMLVPVIFLILPTTILFAVFPGILVLQLGS